MVRSDENNGVDVVIDDRERAAKLDQAVAEISGVAPRVERLTVGDVLVGRRFLIERKATADFIASILDERLFNQMAQLASQPFEPILILEGEFDPNSGSGISARALRGAMLSVSLDWGVPILRARSVRETAQWIQALIGRIQKSVGSPDWRNVSPTGQRTPRRQVPARPRRKSVSPESRRRKQEIELLRQLPGVGTLRAETLLQKFGNLPGVIRASIFDLAETDGIGNRLAEQIFTALHDEPPGRDKLSEKSRG